MTFDHALAFFVFSVTAAVTPGPSNILITAAGANGGITRGLPCWLGVVLGMGLMMGVVALGLGSIILETPALSKAMQWAGAAVLLWMSRKIATAGRPSDGSAEPVGFLAAAAFQWINPKSWLVCASAAAYLSREDGGVVLEALQFGAIFIAAAAPACFLWLALGAVLQRRLQSERTARLFNITMGCLLAGSLVLLIG
jgi:threonine/homoserine/homoserine lactone efflux protein